MSLESDLPTLRYQGSDPSAIAEAGKWQEKLFTRISAITDVLQAGAAQSDNEGRLVRATVDALRTQEFWRMRLCRELGGLELSIVLQIRVLAALAEKDAASAWCSMVANSALGVLGATMPSDAIKRIFADRVPVCTIVASSGGVATPVAAGYLLNGTWRHAAGIHHSDWIYATAHVERDPSRLLSFAIPANDVDLLPSWNAVGLAGTGSNDFTLKNYFLPTDLAGNEGNSYRQVRGLRRYDLVELEHLESYEHLAFAIGTGRRALSELRTVLVKPFAARHGADREIVRRQLGNAVVRLQSVEAMTYALYARIDAAALGHRQAWSSADRHLPRALAACATELALESVHLAFNRAITASVHGPNIFEKLLRDMSVAATHVAVGDSAYDSYAQDLLETAAPMMLSDELSPSMLRS